MEKQSLSIEEIKSCEKDGFWREVAEQLEEEVHEVNVNNLKVVASY